MAQCGVVSCFQNHKKIDKIMKRKEHFYGLAIGYFLFFVVLTLSSGVALFLVENGLNPKEKSFEGLIEIVSPHLLGMSIMLFVVTHFLLFSRKYSQKFSLKIFLAVVFLMILDQSSYFFMFIECFSLVKIFSMLGYILGVIILLWMIFFSL